MWLPSVTVGGEVNLLFFLEVVGRWRERTVEKDNVVLFRNDAFRRKDSTCVLCGITAYSNNNGFCACRSNEGRDLVI